MKHILCSLFVLIATFCKAQMVITLDSDSAFISGLEQRLKQRVPDSVKAVTAFSLSQVYKRTGDSVKTKHYLNLGNSFAKGDEFLHAVSLYYEAFAMLGLTDNNLVENKLKKSDSLLKKFNTPFAFKMRANTWIALGVLEQIKGSEKKGLDAYMNYALPFAKKSGDVFVTGNANKFIATIFINSDERDKASGYLKAALENFEKSPASENPSKLEAIVETSIISAENDVYLGKFDLAKQNLDKAKSFLTPYPSSNIYLLYYLAEGMYYNKIKDHHSALTSFDKGIAMGNTPALVYYINRLKYARFTTLTSLNRFKEAINVLQELIKNPAIFNTDRKIYYKDLSTTYAKTGNMSQAYHWSQKYISLTDSLYNTKYQADLVELEKKYNTAEHENRINLLEAEKRKNAYEIKTARLNASLWATGCILFLVMAAFLFYFLKNNKRLAKQKEINHQQELKQIEQQQHIALGEAIMKGEELEQQRIARDLHDGLGGSLASIKIKLSHDIRKQLASHDKIDDIIARLDDSLSELRRIARNMMPETLVRFGIDTSLYDLCSALSNAETKVNYESYGISGDIDISKQIVIYRIVQEGLANALRHAEASVIDLQCSQNDNLFFITIEDNGKGFNGDILENKKGVGLSNIENRVKFLNGRIDINSLPGEGTSLNIELNLGDKT